MSEMNNVIEAHGEDIEGAIQSGLEQLGLSRDQVSVEVVEEGSRGFLGLGSRPAVVRLQAKGPAAALAPKPTSEIGPDDSPAISVTRELPPTEPQPQPVLTKEVEKEAAETGTAAVSEEERQAEIEIAVEVTRGLLQHLQIQASVDARLSEPDDLTGERLPIIDLRGRDLAVLIGPQGETLNALQYVARLMAGHVLQRRANFIIDVESYRERRKQALERLAERMAGKVIQGGRAVILEPMPANERRIIHVTLRDHLQVYTKSIGEGRHRQVRILPKTNET
jgi:spoIIIJ-associated protein